tara:strand:- start:104 stop:493 length:390 start_codon:yes stop_codon:yes gene_type:complete
MIRVGVGVVPVIMIMPMTMIMPVLMRMVMPVIVTVVVTMSGANSFYVMVMTFLGESDLILEAQYLIAIFALLTIHMVFAAQNIVDALGKRIEYQWVVVEIASFNEVDLGMACGDNIGVIMNSFHQHAGE